MAAAFGKKDLPRAVEEREELGRQDASLRRVGEDVPVLRAVCCDCPALRGKEATDVQAQPVIRENDIRGERPTPDQVGPLWQREPGGDLAGGGVVGMRVARPGGENHATSVGGDEVRDVPDGGGEFRALRGSRLVGKAEEVQATAWDTKRSGGAAGLGFADVAADGWFETVGGGVRLCAVSDPNDHWGDAAGGAGGDQATAAEGFVVRVGGENDRGPATGDGVQVGRGKGPEAGQGFGGGHAPMQRASPIVVRNDMRMN
jgi:hypothetical protein